jgi:hypothetical protein
MFDLDTYLVPAPNVVGRMIDAEAVLVLPDKGQVKVVNEVGARIWALTDGSRSIREIASVICSEFEVDLDTAEADTLEFIKNLVQRGILLPKPAAG